MADRLAKEAPTEDIGEIVYDKILKVEFTAIVTGHVSNRSHLHRFKIIPNSTCPCRLQEEQTINHIIFNCTQLENERGILQNANNPNR
jgi:hypothetical protein